MLTRAIAHLSRRLPAHVISLWDFDSELMHAVFEVAQAFHSASRTERRVAVGSRVAVLFYQPSTRTRVNFELAAGSLGSAVSGFASADVTRAGDFYQETLEDVIRFTAAISDLLVLRHFETGAGAKAAAVSPKPIISAGDGYNEHPTQALGDLWTMHRILGGLRGRCIGLVGNPGIRSLRSIAIGLSKLGPARVIFLPAPETAVPADIEAALNNAGIAIDLVENIGAILRDADLLETIGTRHPNHSLAKDRPTDALTDPAFRIDVAMLERVGRRIPILHPGPRTDEIHSNVDAYPEAAYFSQAENGLYVRMALIAGLLLR